jgi:hypothetical protein
MGEPAVVTRRRVFAIATDTAGCWHYRLHLPLTHLDPERFEVIWRGPDPAELAAGDVVVGQRLADDNPAWRRVCETPGVLAVYDLDDNLLNVDPANTIPYSLYGRPDVAENIKANIAAADVVTVSTHRLAALCRAYNKQVVVLQNCVHPASVVPAERRPGVTTIGWAGSPFHAQDWTDHDRASLRRVAGNGVRFRTIGADYMGGIPNEHNGWSTMDAYWRALDFDVGLAPLADTPFNSSKSWIKALEYMSRGVIPVVPAIGQYPDLVDDEVNGLTYPGARGDNLQEALTFLLGRRDTNWLSALSEGALATARMWTIDKQAHRWAAVYEGNLAS